MTAQIRLVEVTDANRDAVTAVRVLPGQERFVASVEKSFADAEKYPEGKPWYRAVYVGDEPVGFVMVSWNNTPGPGLRGPFFLWRLLIGAEHQGHGYGTAILDQVVELIRTAGATELITSYVPGDGCPEPFYRRYGFRPTGEIDEEGEVVITLPLG